MNKIYEKMFKEIGHSDNKIDYDNLQYKSSSFYDTGFSGYEKLV